MEKLLGTLILLVLDWLKLDAGDHQGSIVHTHGKAIHPIYIQLQGLNGQRLSSIRRLQANTLNIPHLQ